MSRLAAIDAAWGSLKPKHGVNHVTLSPDDWRGLLGHPGVAHLRNAEGYTVALEYRGRPLVRGPHYHGPGVLWSRYGDVLHPTELASDDTLRGPARDGSTPNIKGGAVLVTVEGA